MQRISSPNYPLTRDLIPALKKPKVVLVGLGAALLLLVTGLWILLAIPLTILLLLVAIHHSPNVVFTNFCQDAWIEDDGLLLQLKDEQVRVPFQQIREVTWHGSNNPPRAKVWLKSPNEHGDCYTFVPSLFVGHAKAKENVLALNARLSAND